MIPNETKAKVFNLYHGQYVNSSSGRCRLRDQDFIDSLDWIELRPITALTDEEKNELASIMGTLRVDYFSESLHEGLTFSLNIHKTIQAYQYLQSIGIDLPQYLLNGQTLKEAGLAVYDET